MMIKISLVLLILPIFAGNERLLVGSRPNRLLKSNAIEPGREIMHTLISISEQYRNSTVRKCSNGPKHGVIQIERDTDTRGK